MSARFTRGPWSLHCYTPAGGRTVSVDECAAHGAFEANNVAFGVGDMVLGEVSAHKFALSDQSSGYPRVSDFDENLANARLIAAAPDLYAALEKMLEMWEPICRSNGWEPGHVLEYGEALEALKKARGEA